MSQLKRSRKPKATADKRPGASQLSEYVQPAVDGYYQALSAADLAWTIVALLDEVYTSAALTVQLSQDPQRRAAERPPGRETDTVAFLDYALSLALREQKSNPQATVVADFFSLERPSFTVTDRPDEPLPTAEEFLNKLYAQTWRTKRADQLAKLAPKLVARLPELSAVLDSRFQRLELAMEILRRSAYLDTLGNNQADIVAAERALDTAVDAYTGYTRGGESLSRSPATEDRVLLDIDSSIKWHLYTVPFEQRTVVSAIDLAHARSIKLIDKLSQMSPGRVELRADPDWLQRLVASVVNDVNTNTVAEQLEELAPGALDQYKPERSAWTSVDALLRSGEFVEGLNTGADAAGVPSADSFGGNFDQTVRLTPDMFAAYAAAAAAPQPKVIYVDDDDDSAQSDAAASRRPDIFTETAAGEEETQDQDDETFQNLTDIVKLEDLGQGLEQLRIDAALRGGGKQFTQRQFRASSSRGRVSTQVGW